MARIDLSDEADHPELEELVGRIKQGRQGSLINVYHLLLNNPAIAEIWIQHLTAVRWKTGLSGRLRVCWWPLISTSSSPRKAGSPVYFLAGTTMPHQGRHG